MNKPQKNQNLEQVLERANTALTTILEKLVVFNDSLKPVELSLRVSDFSSKGVLRLGTINGIVCVLTSMIKGDPYSKSLGALEGKGLKLPSIIKSADRSESRHTCNSIIKIIESLERKNSPRFVVNLRWSILPRSLDHTKAIVMGTRYNNLNASDTQQILSAMKQRGFDVLKDDGEYGGGLLTYLIIESLHNKRKLKVLELTLSKEIAESENHVIQVLEALSTL